MTNSLRPGECPDDEEVRARLLGVIIAREVDLLEAPHVVVCRSRYGDQDSFSGPYPTGLAALRVAIRDQDAEEAAGNFEVGFDVAPLLPPRGVSRCE